MKRAVHFFTAMIMSMVLLIACGRSGGSAKLDLCGVSMEVMLTLDSSFGLIRVTGTAEEAAYEKLEHRLEGQLSDYRTGAQPNDGASWKSETVMDQYEEEALAEAYASVFGDGVIDDTYLKGILASPLVFYELKRTGEGCRFVVDATVKEEMAYIFADQG